MPITRATLDPLLLRTLGRKFAAVELDGVTADGTNGDLVGPLLSGLASLGVVPANPLAVTDADLALVAPGDVPQLLAVATFAGLEAVLANWVDPDQSEEKEQKGLGRLYDSIERTVARLRSQLQREYGIGLGTVTTGVFDLGFAETIDPTTGVPD